MGTHPIFESDFDCLTDMIDFSDLQKVGLGLVFFGSSFMTIGVFLFMDRVLLALGNLLFVSGICLIIGLGRAISFFWQPNNPVKMKGSLSFFGGIGAILFGWPVVGMILEFYGFFVLFGGFLPIILTFIGRIPVIGYIVNLPLFSSYVQKHNSMA